MPPVVIAAGIGAAGAIGGAMLSSNAASDAAKAQEQGNAQAIAEQSREYNQSRTDLAPWRTTGASALDQLAKIYGLSTADANGNVTKGGGKTPDYSSFYQSPDYKFARKQGIMGIDAGAAATGSLDSGATRKAELKYASNLATSNFNSYADRLAGIAGVGQSATNTTTQAGENSANNISQIDQNTGANRASSYLAQGNAYGNAIGQLAGIGSGLITNTGGGGYNPSNYSSLSGATVPLQPMSAPLWGAAG